MLTEYDSVKIGSVWKHKGGALYIVVAITNTLEPPKEKFPPTFVYANLSSMAARMVVEDETLIPEQGPAKIEFFSAQADDWKRRMTEVAVKDTLYATIILGRMTGLARILRGERL